MTFTLLHASNLSMTKREKDTEALFQSAGETFTYLREYLQLQLDLLRLDLAERIAKVASALVSVLVLMIFALIGLFMTTIALALFLGQIWGSYALGFLSIAGFYFLLVAVLYAFKERLITNPILGSLLRAFFQNTTQTDNHDSSHS